MNDAGKEPPIVVALDGSLIKSRWLDEAVLELLRAQPAVFCRVAWQLLSGAPSAPSLVAESAALDVEAWPADGNLVARLTAEAERGRRIVLATSAPERVAAAVVRAYPFLGQVIPVPPEATPQEIAGLLARAFPEGFIDARAAGGEGSKRDLAPGRMPVEPVGQESDRPLGAPGSFLNLWRAMRPHQWAKNLLIFVPLVLGGRGDELQAWLEALTGALAISLVASAMYIVNDLLDLPSDRRHWSKKARAIASGEVSIRHAALAAAILAVIGLVLAASQGIGPLIVVAIYMAVTAFYSAHWKSVPILDVFVLAVLFTLRLWLGIALTNVRLSSWLLVFSMFLFLSLSLAKRHTEVLRMREHGLVATPGRAYRAEDAPLTLALGIASAMAGVLIMILYLIEDAFPRQQYVEPQLLWAVPPILFLFLGRLWLLCQRGALHDDPVAFAMRDRISLTLGGAMSVVALLALVGTGLR